MSRRPFRYALVTVVATIAIVGGLAAVGVREVVGYPDRVNPGQQRAVALEIPRGARFPQVTRLLVEQGLIDRPFWFRVYATHRGLAGRVRAGRYALRDDLTPRQLLDTLVAGVQEQERLVTIPEGKNLLEVCALLEVAGVAPAVELEAAARDAAWLASLGIAGETADGYLFPDTYRFRTPTPARAALTQMVRRHREVFDELRRKHERSVERWVQRLDFTDRHLVVMASIVEKETAAPAERTIVASVFYNRLTAPGFTSRRLETDPTIRYGCTVPTKKSAACRAWDPAGRLFRRQLDDAENPYNTYQHKGLPPGPIGNPGRLALEAAMAPAKTDYFFFVAKNEREHVFSRTYAEHTRYVEQYQK